ncbi:MAG: phosphinothricin N-acetyltransferase [Phycisphaerae bacterium]|nr:MAG: phosphinothricin N-acetyltransferase [Phycisphaerae bacterium]
MPDPVLIRPAMVADFDAIAALTNHFIEHTAIHFGLAPVTADELRASWEKGRARFPYLVAEAEGRFAGYAKAGPWRERAAYDHTAEVGIYIALGMQGRGVGKALYAALFEACKAAGFHTLVAGLTVPNEASRRLHEAMGFTYVGTFREVGRKFDAWHDTAWYQRVL